MMALFELAIVLALMPSLYILVADSDTLTVREIAAQVALGFNLILLVMSVWLMIEGAKKANRSYMVRGSLLFALLAMARYTDLFDSLINRAVVFLVVGISLFAVSHVYQRNKRQVGV